MEGGRTGEVEGKKERLWEFGCEGGIEKGRTKEGIEKGKEGKGKRGRKQRWRWRNREAVGGRDMG